MGTSISGRHRQPSWICVCHTNAGERKKYRHTHTHKFIYREVTNANGERESERYSKLGLLASQLLWYSDQNVFVCVRVMYMSVFVCVLLARLLYMTCSSFLFTISWLRAQKSDNLALVVDSFENCELSMYKIQTYAYHRQCFIIKKTECHFSSSQHRSIHFEINKIGSWFFHNAFLLLVPKF